MRKLGWFPDPHKRPGERQDDDAAASLKASAVPESASVEEFSRIIDQGHLGSCVANAVAQAVHVSHKRAGVKEAKLLSRLFLYFFARSYHGATKEDEGTYIRFAFSALNKFGFCAEELWSYDDGSEKYKRMPSTVAIMGAYDQRSPTVYRRIYEDGDERLAIIRQAIAAGHAVVFGTDVSIAFTENRLGSEPILPPTGEPIAGGHAMCVVGYDKSRFRVANSWGASWGDGGYCNFSPKYLAWPNTRDLWIVESAPKYSG